MLHNNLDILVAQVKQHQQDLLVAAAHAHRVQAALRTQPSLFRQALIYGGELLVTSGEWLKARGELSAVSRTVVTR